MTCWRQKTIRRIKEIPNQISARIKDFYEERGITERSYNQNVSHFLLEIIFSSDTPFTQHFFVVRNVL